MSYLLKPLQAGSLALSNRLVLPPMATGKTKDGLVNQAIIDYYQEKSEGGFFSLIIIEHSYVSPEGKAHPGQLSVADDGVIEGLKDLAKVIHQNGSKTVMQINHAGSAAMQEVIGKTPVAPSAVQYPAARALPDELSKEEIAAIVLAFQNAARRVKDAGFDGVVIHSAHGYLLNQFFSPLSNKRTDEYGGPVMDRIRIHLEIISAIREIAGQDFALLLRLGAFDYADGGITLEDSQTAAKAFEKAGIDILDISGSFTGYNSPDSTEQGYFSPLTEAIRQVVSIPVILTGGITEAFSAEKLLAEGKADLVGVGRAVLKDSLWAKHAVESLNAKKA